VFISTLVSTMLFHHKKGWNRKQWKQILVQCYTF